MESVRKTCQKKGSGPFLAWRQNFNAPVSCVKSPYPRHPTPHGAWSEPAARNASLPFPLPPTRAAELVSCRRHVSAAQIDRLASPCCAVDRREEETCSNQTRSLRTGINAATECTPLMCAHVVSLKLRVVEEGGGSSANLSE